MECRRARVFSTPRCMGGRGDAGGCPRAAIPRGGAERRDGLSLGGRGSMSGIARRLTKLEATSALTEQTMVVFVSFPSTRPHALPAPSSNAPGALCRRPYGTESRRGKRWPSACDQQRRDNQRQHDGRHDHCDASNEHKPRRRPVASSAMPVTAVHNGAASRADATRAPVGAEGQEV